MLPHRDPDVLTLVEKAAAGVYGMLKPSGLKLNFARESQRSSFSFGAQDLDWCGNPFGLKTLAR